MKKEREIRISDFRSREIRLGKFGIYLGNPSRRNRPSVYQVIKQRYNPKTGDVYNIYCIGGFGSKTLNYFVEVESKMGYDHVINSESYGLRNLSLRDCQNLVKSFIEDEVF